MTEKIRVELSELTLGELAELGEILAPVSLTDAMEGPKQAYAIAAIVTLVRRRVEPDYSIEQALALKMGDIELVAPAPEASSASDGATHLSLPEPGASIRSA